MSINNIVDFNERHVLSCDTCHEFEMWILRLNCTAKCTNCGNVVELEVLKQKEDQTVGAWTLVRENIEE
jgi:uncharacterized Zn finger protein